MPPGHDAGAEGEHAFAAGTLIADRYRIVSLIGTGGMGEVYAAADLVLGTTVALKTLRTELADSPRALERLRREIALARKVTHRHVCRLHDLGEHVGRVYLTMELLAGETLADRLRRAGPLAGPELAAIGTQLVDGLAALHAAGIVHRDVKTANVLLVGDGAATRAVITDFGLARSTEDHDAVLTLEHGLLGTPSYMSPEQVESRPATAASDVYSLGVVLYELATGQLPFREDTAMATAIARVHRDPDPPSRARASITAGWDALILRCLARQPSRRFATAADVGAAIGEAEGAAVPAGRRRLQRIAIVSAALGVGLVVAVVLGLAATRATPHGAAVAAPHVWPIAIRPRDPTTVVHFVQAERSLLADDWTGGRELLEQGVAAQPTDPIGQAVLAGILHELGYAERSADANERAMAYRDVVTGPQRDYIELQDAIIRGDRDARIARYRALAAAVPDERVYAVGLALALAERPEDAPAALAALGEPRDATEEVTIELAQAAVAGSSRGLDAQLDHATRALRAAERGGRKTDIARAELVVGAARWGLGDPAAAAASYQHALELAESIGHTGLALQARTGLLDLDLEADRMGPATERTEGLVELTRRLGDRKRLVGLLNDAARLLLAIGDVPRATDDNTEQARVAAELHCDLCAGWADATHAFIALQTGRLAEAGQLAEAGFRRGVAEDVQGLQGNSFHTWSEAMLELDDDAGLARARETRGPSVERLADCYAALRVGDFDRAKRIGETLANWRTREGREAYVSVADAMLAQGKLDDAGQILDKVEPLLIGDGASLLAKRRVLWAQAELAARRGDVARALANLDAQAAECAAHDLTYCELRSAALAIQLTRDAGDAHRRATAILERARSAGFNRIVREVEAAVAR